MHSLARYEWVMSYKYMDMHTWQTHEWVMAHIWISHGINMWLQTPRAKETFCPYEWITTHTLLSHVTHMNESCHIGMVHSWILGLRRFSYQKSQVVLEKKTWNFLDSAGAKNQKLCGTNQFNPIFLGFTVLKRIRQKWVWMSIWIICIYVFILSMKYTRYMSVMYKYSYVYIHICTYTCIHVDASVY